MCTYHARDRHLKTTAIHLKPAVWFPAQSVSPSLLSLSTPITPPAADAPYFCNNSEYFEAGTKPLGGWPAAVASPMAAAAGAAAAGGSRASPTVHLRPADASRNSIGRTYERTSETLKTTF